VYLPLVAGASYFDGRSAACSAWLTLLAGVVAMGGMGL